MNIIRPMGLVAFTLTAALCMTTSATAGSSKEQRRAEEAKTIRTAVERGQLIALPRILALAHQRVKGDVVKVELEHEEGRLLYEIKILTGNGRVREVKLDARTGALIEIEDD